MKAMVCTRYGPPEVLELQQLDKPVPKAAEILVKVRASTVTAGDCEIRGFTFPVLLRIPLRLFFGVRKPRVNVLGQEFAGEVEAVGTEHTLFKKGDRVYGATGLKLGAYADYLCLPGSYAIARIPERLSFEEAATISTGGMNALFFLQKARIRAGQKVLVIGAGGSIGTVAVQLAKNSGAEVTAVDSSEKLDMLLSIGADKVIDYRKEDFTANGETYDVIFDVAGKSPFSKTVNSLKSKGIYLMGNPSLAQMFRRLLPTKKGDRKIIAGAADYKAEDLSYLNKLLADGKIKPVVDQIFPLEQLRQAHHYVESGVKKGNVVIINQ
ncbi:NAD(P)-dependent alcohol dehydrogenase [Planomicrobium sp. CPCC 101110]|uniref:NAD(P)-dependent alcohol dehydrogenase n=1 Tax=Planomicrobium sp. CPCC 101110 TaxID=2599619 RepID=UPI0011B78E42|nr:NAD(P)-dependent alcohol dehydrogenase [Planomicrobium sp. CPCC 101110]TWT25283.1 NAD(P)-dependent alcohol dehydrogenase [Planomicrobium sp. CPCC 101110]